MQFSGTSFFSEAQLSVNGAGTLNLVFNPSGHGPSSNAFPDSFFAVLLDALTGLPVLDSTDPSGNGGLFVFSIDGTSAGSTQLYQPQSGNVTWDLQPFNVVPNAVPEPGSLPLVLLALGVFNGRRRIADRRRAAGPAFTSCQSHRCQIP